MAPWGEVSGPEDRRLPARWLRKEFSLDKKIRRATAYLSGLGLSELYLNGQKVSDDVLSPALSDYSKRVFYVTRDVTALLRRGPNALGVVLGNGRFFAPRSRVPTGTDSYGSPKLLLQLQLEFADGSSATIISDATWKLTTNGPIRANNEYDGEEYDARLELNGWSEAGYDDSHWPCAALVTPPGGVLAAQMIEPIRVMQTLEPAALSQPRPGVFIFDFGQNLVGWCRLRVSGPRGTTVSLRHAETLKPDGTLYTDNLRSAKVTDTYTLKGRGRESYEPRFTYHGFRYVEVTGYPGKPALSTLRARVVHDDLPSAGDFTCSNPLLNRILDNIRWGVRGNYRSIPTDCPQRDERQGWLGDRSAESLGETFLFQTVPLYTKWLQDMADAQKPSGSVPDVCPAYWPIYSDNVTWPSSTVIIPGALRDQFGDSAIIAAHYESAKKWMDYMSGFVTNGLISRDSYGDWCVPPEDPKLIHSNDPERKTDRTLIATAYFYHDCLLMAQYATLLCPPVQGSGFKVQGSTLDVQRSTPDAPTSTPDPRPSAPAEEAANFRHLAHILKLAFNAKFLNRDTAQYDNGSQTSFVLPLAFGLAPDDLRLRLFERLTDKIQNGTAGHIGTGLIGGQWLMRVLSDNGRPDLAYQIAAQSTYPSWGYMVQKGATTIWELWNGDTADPAMNSGNHVMLVGDLTTWLYEYLAGIRPDPAQPGFKHVLLRPEPVGDLRFVRATHQSPYGLIASSWRRDAKGVFTWDITIPANTTATAWVPAESADAVREGRHPALRSRAVRFLRCENHRVLFELGSGAYRFEAR